MSFDAARHIRVIRLVAALRALGFNVDVWAARKPIRRPRPLKILNYVLALIEAALVKADLYWVENIPDLPYVVLPLLRRRYIFDRRNVWWADILSEFGRTPKPLLKILEILDRYLASRAAANVAASTPLAKYLIGIESIVIPNLPFGDICRGVKPVEKPPNRNVVLIVATLNSKEGADIIPMLAWAVMDVAEVWVLGDGPLMPLLKRVASKIPSLKLFGYVPHSEVRRFIAAADVCVGLAKDSPVRTFATFESVLKLGEYLSCGKPVVVSGVMPSKYYVVVPQREVPKIVKMVLLNRIKPPIIRLFINPNKFIKLVENVINMALKNT